MRLPGKGMSWKTFGKRLKAEYKDDAINDRAAALTYFGVLALFPFILFLVALGGLFIDPTQIQSLVQQLATVAPQEAVSLIEGRLQSLAQSTSGGLLGLSIVGAIWAASNGVAALIRALNRMYDVEESRPGWKVRGLAILVTLFAAAFTLAATLVAVAAPAVANSIGGPVGTAVNWLRLPVAGLVVMFVWAVLFWALPDAKQRFKFLTPGAVVGVLIWVAASWGFSVYVRNFGSYDATYGALGGVIVMLLWMYISAQALLLGAEINSVIEHASEEGKAPGEKERGEGGRERRPGEEGRLPPERWRTPPPEERTLH